MRPNDATHTLLNHREGDAAFVGEHSDSILSAIGDLMLTHSPCDMDDPDLLRALWFLIAVKTQINNASFEEHHETS